MSNMDMNKPSAIRVTPEVLFEKAELVSSDIEMMKEYISSLAKVVRRSGSYWSGEAGELHRTIFEKQKIEVDSVLTKLSAHPGNLLKIGNIYKQTEDAVTGQSSELPHDIIM